MIQVLVFQKKRAEGEECIYDEEYLSDWCDYDDRCGSYYEDECFCLGSVENMIWPIREKSSREERFLRAWNQIEKLVAWAQDS